MKRREADIPCGQTSGSYASLPRLTSFSYLLFVEGKDEGWGLFLLFHRILNLSFLFTNRFCGSREGARETRFLSLFSISSSTLQIFLEKKCWDNWKLNKKPVARRRLTRLSLPTTFLLLFSPVGLLVFLSFGCAQRRRKRKGGGRRRLPSLFFQVSTDEFLRHKILET